MKVYLFLAEGFEEMEAIIPIDIFRRADIEVIIVSINDNLEVRGAHGITILANKIFNEIHFSGNFLLFLPGGLPGTTNLDNHLGLKQLIASQNENCGKIAAICAAPSILGKMGILKGKEAICYPGFENQLIEAKLATEKMVKTDNIFTAKAAGVSIQFALKIVEDIKGKVCATKIEKAIFLH